MTAVIIIVAMLAAGSFLFWLAHRYDSFITGCAAIGALFAAVSFANGVLS